MSRPRTAKSLRRCAAYASTFAAFEEWSGHVEVHRRCDPCNDFAEVVHGISRKLHAERHQDFAAVERSGDVARLFDERVRRATELPDVLEMEKRLRGMLSTLRKRKAELAAVKIPREPWDRTTLAKKAGNKSPAWVTRNKERFKSAERDLPGHTMWDPDLAEGIIATLKATKEIR